MLIKLLKSPFKGSENGVFNTVRIAMLVFACFAMFNFASCNHGVGGGGGSKAKGTVTVSLQFDGAGTGGQQNVLGPLWTVYPDLTGFTKYEVTFNATSGGAAHDPVVITDLVDFANTIDVELVVGTYKVTVTAYTGSSPDYKAAATGEAEGVAVEAGDNDPIEIVMEPSAEGGDGTFSYSVTIPDGATGTLTITTLDGGTVASGTKNLTNAGVAANTGTLDLAPGNYRLAVNLSKGSETAKFSNEVIYIYPGLTSTFEYGFTDAHFKDPEPGALGLNIFFGFEDIPVANSDGITITKGGESVTLTVPADAGFTNINWYVDGSGSGTTGDSITLDPEGYTVGIHLLTVNAVKSSKPYSEILEFTVVAEDGGGGGGGGFKTVGPVDASGLATLLASDSVPAGTAETPTVVQLNTFDVTGNTWGGTVKSALTGLTKYIILDLSNCTATDNTITGNGDPGNNNFNVINGNTYVVGVILPSTVTIIDLNALSTWTSLRYVTLPTGLLRIKSNAFMATPNLKSITIPSTVTNISGGAFQTSGLESITIPGSVAKLFAGTFEECDSLASVTFENGSITIEKGTFDGDLYEVYSNAASKAGTYTRTAGTREDAKWAKAD